MSIRSTAPAGCPRTGALGTATNAVVLSVQTNMLSVAPSNPTDEAALSCALFTIPRALLDGLKTTVRSFLGLTAIIPASGTVPERETPKGLKTSLEASTMSSAGNIAPKLLELTGLEMNARNL